jgi:hypothetical protein
MDRVSGRVTASVTPATNTATKIQNTIAARSLSFEAGNRIATGRKQADSASFAHLSRI